LIFVGRDTRLFVTIGVVVVDGGDSIVGVPFYIKNYI